MRGRRSIIAVTVACGVLCGGAGIPPRAERAYWTTDPAVGVSSVEITLEIGCVGNLSCLFIDGYSSTRSPLAAGSGSGTLVPGGSLELALDTPLGDPPVDAWTVGFQPFAFDPIAFVGTPMVENGLVFGSAGGPFPLDGLVLGPFGPLPTAETLPVGFLFDVTGLQDAFTGQLAGPAPEAVGATFEMLDGARFELHDLGWTVSDSQASDLMPGTLTVTVTAVVRLNLSGTILLELSVERAGLGWTALADAVGYDVVRGDLQRLRAAAGDFAVAATTCAADDHPAGTLPVADDPGPGEGTWFLVRGVTPAGPLSYDTPFSSQAASRDAGVNAAAGACP